MTRRYSNTAVETTLSSGVTAANTTIPVSSTTGFPSVDFVLALDPGQPTQELVLVTGVAGLNLTVTRGYDNTTAIAHDAGAVVRHSHAAVDFREGQEHRDATADVHGVTGSLVGSTAVQTLTNKNLADASNVFPSTLATDAEVTTQVNAAASTAATNLATHEADTSTHGVAEIVGRTEVQTLTNKTLTAPTLTQPTLTGNVTMSDKLQAGTDSITPSAADTTTTKTVTFPFAFPVVPKVTITDATGIATGYNVTLWVAHADITTTGFVVRIRKGNTNPTDFTWIAVRS